MAGTAGTATEKTLKAWLAAAPVDRGVGDGLTFVATEASARRGKASWILRYRLGGRYKEKVLGRYPDISLKQARDLALRDRVQLQQGVDVAAAKRQKKVSASRVLDVKTLGQLWYERHIEPRYKHPQVVERALRLHVYPVIGRLRVTDVRPFHVDDVLTRTVGAGAPTVANDVLRYLHRIFHFAIKRRWIETNPASGFEQADAGGIEKPRGRWLDRDELVALASMMRQTASFGRINELSVWLLLALCVRKMELLSAHWSEFDLASGVWHLRPSRTKTTASIDIPLAPPVVDWLREVKIHAPVSDYLFPARKLIQVRNGTPRRNRFPHVGPDTLNVALRRLPLMDIEHFTVHDMRRTARTHLAALGVDRFIAERALNHKIRDVEGIYNRHDYFAERKDALSRWAAFLVAVAAAR
ncbi:MAG: tyrosine-type recombinase/integrase [Rhodoferax sp.]|nr:tyrosine-type recombinase/integrase [Rhodoferax sp.]